MTGLKILMLGVVLLLAGLALRWLQDVGAPWFNVGEARMGSTVSFRAGGGDYRVVASGPTRPLIEQTACTITTSHERSFDVLGGENLDAVQHFGVSRVLGFEAPAGTTRVRCADRILRSSTRGRFQVVKAGNVVSTAVTAVLVVGVVLLLGGIFLLYRGYSRHGRMTA